MGKKILDYFYMLLMIFGALMLFMGLYAWQSDMTETSLFFIVGFIGTILMIGATIGSRSLKKADKKELQKKEGFLGKPGTNKRKLNIGCLILIMAMLALAIFIRSMELWL